MVALWVIVLMSLIVGSFAFDAHIEARIMSYYRKRERADRLSRSGVELAEWFIVTAHDNSSAIANRDPPEPPWDLPMKAFLDGASVRLKVGLSLDDGRAVLRLLDDGEAHEGPSGAIDVGIRPVPARRNINNLNLRDNDVSTTVHEDELIGNLERILGEMGIDWSMWDQYIDPFIDWVDPDSTSRGMAAETDDWYNDLGYRARNGPLPVVEEVRLIRNYTNEVVTNVAGSVSFSLADRIVGSGLFTIHGDGRVNVNSASSGVLMTLPDMEPQIAADIVARRWRDDRQAGVLDPYEDWGDLVDRIPAIAVLPAGFAPYLEYVSTVFEIVTAGEVQGVRRERRCVVEYDGAKKRLKVKEWLE